MTEALYPANKAVWVDGMLWGDSGCSLALPLQGLEEGG